MDENIIELKHIKKCYEKNKPVIYDFNLEVKKGEFVTFLGPSGCGKTTILRMIAGFEKPTQGEILFHGKDISALPPNERQVNTVFQKYALFPHLNIFDNIAFGLRQKKMPKDLIREKVKHVLEVVDLEGFEKRSVSSLSGGQQQRIAIARAIVNEPDILLLDEPLGALDYKMRQEMQLELKIMHRELGITFVFVTHDQEEALTMSDKIVVMSKGVLQQTGTAEEIYQSPANAFVADFIGESNIFNGKKVTGQTVSFAGAEFPCRDAYPAGTLIDAMIRPEFVVLDETGAGRLKGTVISSVFKGKHYDITVQSGKNEIIAQRGAGMQVGAEVGVDFKTEGIHNMPRDLRVNHMEGILDDRLRLRLIDGSIPVAVSRVFPEYTEKDGKLYDAQGRRVFTEGRKLEVFFAPEQAQLSDDPEAGCFQGHIVDIIYKGDHYNYRVVSRNQVEYSVDDEYLWNVGDFVSVIVRQEDFMYHDPSGQNSRIRG
ncbi:MAG: ABC transporter ATP-binding protein [Clostridiaceae bacterium]|nr:ABC transporter ATP-binding protein [Clostridiaceae bacterium]